MDERARLRTESGKQEQRRMAGVQASLERYDEN